ncbi:hypothetical protein MJ046_14960 [Acinetobacter bereziniae]|uniref:hypothetical protein n=1 Tax=Acinetobacter bereziniae TaxID=106648 RepID=UPI0022EB232D|nr:hypothetical protein [Acinetobacter bereziniae]MDA3441640.1 hypothetical protein [Acinetobacter bereziniae]
MNLFCKYIPFIFLIGCSSSYKGSENSAEFDKEKINFIAGCSESGTLSVSVCECQFNDLVRKYDKNFYKDKSLMEDNEKPRKFEKIAYQIVEDCEKRLEK